MSSTRLIGRRGQRGFTLLESMAAVALAGIVMSAALPSLQSQVRQARRIDAMQALAALQLAQERWRADHPAYAGDLASLGQPARSASGHYTLAVADADAGRYTLLATAVSTAQQADRACRTLRIALVAGQVRYESLDAAGTPDPDNRRRCWVL